MSEEYKIPDPKYLDSANGAENIDTVELMAEWVKDFNDLKKLGAVGLGTGQIVSFQPYGRYEEGRQTGNVRIWEEDPDLITINFMGSKVGIPYPDNERITRGNFDTRKDVLKIKKDTN